MTQEPQAVHTRTESIEVDDASASGPPATPAPGQFPTTRLVIAALMLLVPLIAYADTIHVDASATGSDDGTSWADAYTDLQDALGEAESGDEIWVAAGVYAPHSGEDRMATFELKNGVGIYGGFDGTEAERDQRDPQDNVTTLSGEFDLVESYHVVSAFETDGSAVLDGFTITDGLAEGDQLVGGGMIIVEASPTLTNLVFRGNSADNRGGGLYNERGGPTLTNVTFSNNDIINRFGGPQDGNGGGMFSLDGDPTLTDVTFHSNDADYGAGGLLISQGTATLTDVFFNDNHADNIGGGLFVSGADATLTNVNFEDNSAGNMGGGMYIEGGATPVLNNATFRDNRAERGGGIFNFTGSYDLTDVVFSGNSAEDGSGGGVFNIGVHETTPTPTLTNVIFSANSASKDGGGIINDVSDAILTNVTFSGNSAGRNGGGSFTDFESSVDIRNTIFWNNQDSSGTDTASASIDFGDEDSGATISHSLVQGCNPDGDWNSDCGADNGDNLPDADPLFVNTPDPDAAPTTAGDLRLQVDSGSPAIDAGNNADNDTSTDLASNVRIVNNTIDLGAYEIVAPSCPEDGMLFVDRDADQPGDGLSWASAFRNLHYALAVTEPCEVWVAEGVYKPTDSTALTVSFELADGVGLYGGFEGTETQRNERDPKANVTVLSGDVDDDDTTDADGVVADATDIAGGNSYNVVTGDGTVDTAILDGFTVTAGNADSPDGTPHDRGGGMWNRDGNPTLHNVVFSGNRAARGGGVSNESGSPILTDVTFSGNSVSSDGGGMHNEGGDPTLTNAAFTGNNADSDGGGLYNYASNLVVTNSVFSGNNASEGGGMWNNSNFEIRNTVFWNNQDSSGIGTAAASIVPGGFANQSISYSLVQGCNPGGTWNTDCGVDGDNNVEDSDPLFVDTPDPSSAPTTAGDVRLLARSPAIDAGNDGFFSDITTATDLDGNDRLFGDSVDLGPFETVYRLLDLETAGDGQGSVITEEPPRFAPDESVSVEAVPAQSSVFDGWTGDFTSADNPLDFTIDTDTALIAAFTLKNFEVTANASGSGTITPPSQSVDYDGTASFIVTPDTNWSVASVTGDTCNPANTTGTTWEAANIEADCAVEASFSIDSFKIGGTVSGLEGDGLELALNDNEILPIADNGAFQFNTEIDHDTEYAVTVDSQPDGQQCTVAQDTGTVAGDDVTSVEVDCSTIEIAIDNGELDFGTLTLPFGQQDPRSITISNAGDPDVVIERFDAPESPFTFDTGSCAPLPRTLAAGETCTVEVGIELGLEGDFSDSIEIDSNAESSPDTVSLRGAVTAVPVPVLGPLGLLLMMVLTGLIAGSRFRTAR